MAGFARHSGFCIPLRKSGLIDFFSGLLDKPTKDPKTGKETPKVIKEDEYQEDGDAAGHHWGRKQADLAAAEVYEDCSFKMRDSIWVSPPDGGIYFTFKLQIIDTCNGDAVVKEKEVTVTMKEGKDNKRPGVKYDPEKHTAGPPKDWPKKDK